MLGHFGFSFVGPVWLAMLLIPNFIWMKNRPEHYETGSENRVLLALERAGQVAVTCCALLFSDYAITPVSLWSLWLVFSFCLMVLYECWWFRYFRSARIMEDMYSSFLGIPVAGAVLPVMAFLLLGIYGRVIWMILSAVVLGVGHIGIHLGHIKK